MAIYHKVIGIDLGTTYSVVAAYSIERQDVKVIPNRQNEPTTPSVVYIAAGGEVSVGRAAKEKQQRDPDGVLIEVKRMMGEKDESNRKEMVTVRQKQYDPETISAFILKELKACAERIIGEEVHDAVITVPAYFKESQKNATREAAKIAKLNPRLIINEPTAAAVAYGLDTNEVQSFIVYDFGGGTFDVSIVRIENENTVEVVGTGGDAHLGGGDIDELLTKWFLTKMQQQYGRDFSENRKLRGKVRLQAEKVKIDLCNQETSQEFFVANPIEGIEEASFPISTQEFSQIIQPLLEKTFVQVQVALDSAAKNYGVTLEDIEAIILVGGSSKIPAVGKQLETRFKKPVKSNLNPDEIVAIGAARMALNFEPSQAAVIKDNEEVKLAEPQATFAGGEATSTNIKDVVSHTLGVGLDEDIYDSLIPKDSIIPHRITRRGYTTAKDNQTSIHVPVYQGENKKASTNFKLGEVVIDGLRPEPKGVHEFEITFALDTDGVFFGELKHLQTGAIKPIQLERGQGAITEKKRMDLAEVVASGNLETAGGPSPAQPEDAMVALINRANQMLPTLPETKRKELEQGIRLLETARQNRNGQEIGTALVNLTMLTMNI
ncbi:Hsp70 family protein [Spirosoma sp.]|uniref:Hsp70 family protein n=1 Tax=Spirosoma sp. TaxID=1899569 RepID=UPI003B3AF2A5